MRKTRKTPEYKTTITRKIFKRMFPRVIKGKISRMDVLHEFVDKADMTLFGAATYYQTFKNEYRGW